MLQRFFQGCDLRVRFGEVVDEHDGGEDEEFVFGDLADIVFHFAQSFIEVFSCVLEVFFLSLFADDAPFRPVDDEGDGRALQHGEGYSSGRLAVEDSFEVCERLSQGFCQV